MGTQQVEAERPRRGIVQHFDVGLLLRQGQEQPATGGDVNVAMTMIMIMVMSMVMTVIMVMVMTVIMTAAGAKVQERNENEEELHVIQPERPSATSVE